MDGGRTVNDIRINVWKVLYDAQSGSSVVLLRTDPDEQVIPIWIGQAEALSIAVGSEKVSLGRPMTHDLLKSVIEIGDMSVEWILIHDLKEGTFYASIRLNNHGDSVEIDARPSDAVALALRCDAPMFVAEHVLAEVLRDEKALPSDVKDLSEDFLASLPDELFGKYKM
jgi:bifunctional DNase/RNase